MYIVYLVDVVLIWQFGKSCKDCQINYMPLSSIYTASTDVFTQSTEICQFKIPPIALFEQIATEIFDSPIIPLIRFIKQFSHVSMRKLLIVYSIFIE